MFLILVFTLDAQARTLVREKNNDELVQHFLWHTRGAPSQVHPTNVDPTQATSLTADKIKDDSVQGRQAHRVSGYVLTNFLLTAAHHLRTLVSLLITNSEARKLFSDLSLIARDLFARSANLVRPEEDALRQVDEPVANDEPKFQGKGKAPSAEEELLRRKMPDARHGSEKVFNATAGTAMGLNQRPQPTSPTNQKVSEIKGWTQTVFVRGLNLKDKRFSRESKG